MMPIFRLLLCPITWKVTKMRKITKMRKTRYNRIRESIINLIDNVERFYWTSDCLNRELSVIRNSEDWKKLLKCEQTHFNGFIEGLLHRHYLATTHAYLCQDGYFRRTTNVVCNGDKQDNWETYKMPIENSPKSIVDDTCVLVWKDKPNMVYRVPEFLASHPDKCEYKNNSNGDTMGIVLRMK